MELQITVNCLLTPEAATARRRAGGAGFNFVVHSPSAACIPNAGDLLSFGDDEAEVYEVRNRMFLFRSQVELVVQLLLGVAPGGPTH